MIEKIILCQHPNIENAPANFLCSAILIFKENMPIEHAYCEILKDQEDLFIQTSGWSIAKECTIKKIQMYVRNKSDIIKAGEIPAFETACKQRNKLLMKQGRYFEEDFEAIELTDEEQSIANETHPKLEALEKAFQKDMQSIVDNVNEEWKQ